MYIIYIHSLSLSLCVSLCLCLCLCLSLLLFLWEGMVGSKTVKSVSMKQIFEEKGELKRFQTWVCNCLLTKCLTTRHIWGGGGGGLSLILFILIWILLGRLFLLRIWYVCDLSWRKRGEKALMMVLDVVFAFCFGRKMMLFYVYIFSEINFFLLFYFYSSSFCCGFGYASLACSLQILICFFLQKNPK